jgi:2-desacetyl-2-hydroxyethyl bacteriochlorophyllide A dehydrogenase
MRKAPELGVTAKAFWVVAPGRGAIRDEALPVPAADEVVVDALFSGISRGTEALVFRGQVPQSEYRRMRAPFQSGEFPAPVKYGYASVGRIVDGTLSGRLVFALYPHQTRYVVPGTSVYVLPASVPPGRAVLAANLETAINGLWDGAVRAGDRVAVVGAGTVGCLVAWLAGRMPGCDVQLVDIDARRAEVAAALGVSFAVPESAAHSADVVFHTSGTPAGLETALHLAGFESTVVDMSWYGDQLVTLPLGGAFHAERLTITSSQVGQVATSQRARWNHRRRMELALRMLADSTLDVLITGESRFDELPDVMMRLAASPDGTLCHRIRY